MIFLFSRLKSVTVSFLKLQRTSDSGERPGRDLSRALVRSKLSLASTVGLDLACLECLGTSDTTSESEGVLLCFLEGLCLSDPSENLESTSEAW